VREHFAENPAGVLDAFYRHLELQIAVFVLGGAPLLYSDVGSRAAEGHPSPPRHVDGQVELNEPGAAAERRVEHGLPPSGESQVPAGDRGRESERGGGRGAGYAGGRYLGAFYGFHDGVEVGDGLDDVEDFGVVGQEAGSVEGESG